MSSVTLSVLIPCYNEGETLRAMIDQVARQAPLVGQIVVANDGSTDQSRQILDQLASTWKNPNVALQIKHLDPNQGKGAAVRAALELATEPFILIQDADLELDPTNYQALMEPILSQQTEVVFGDRFHSGFPVHLRFASRVANWAVTFMSNRLYGLQLKDQACGYKILPTSLAKALKLRSDGFEICSEMTAKIGLLHLPIHSVPVRYTPRDSTQGKKIRWIDGFIAIYTLGYCRLISWIRRPE